ncbi:hypothetical protein ABZ642_01750 [Streptomyces sp. NPDC007157]|uniref:hypothetical protein n=1 Tax=Streptomyces sp. NPDC007157 TaxID=3154681 RepID=UPI00340B1AC4
MAPWSWGADLMTGLKWWQRAVLIVCLGALTLPLWFAAKNVYRFVDGHRTSTEGHVRCAWDGPCRGAWRLPGGQQGRGEIEGLSFQDDEELVTGIPLYAGRDWAVADRSDLLVHAAQEAGGAVIGAALVLSVAWIRSRDL